MYLHIGNNRIIRKKDIIGIFDSDTATVSSVTKKYLARAEKDKRSEATNAEIPKSFVLYADKKQKKNYRLCFSQLSTGSLLNRMTGKDGN